MDKNKYLLTFSAIAFILMLLSLSSCGGGGGDSAYLTDLEISVGTLSPSFGKTVLAYSTKVTVTTTSITFKPTAEAGDGAVIKNKTIFL